MVSASLHLSSFMWTSFWIFIVVCVLFDGQFGVCQAVRIVDCQAPRMTLAGTGTTQYRVILTVWQSIRDETPDVLDNPCLCQSVVTSTDGDIDGFTLDIGNCEDNGDGACANNDTPTWKCACPFGKSFFGECTCYHAQGDADTGGCKLDDNTVWPLYPEDSILRYLLEDDRQVCWPICEQHIFDLTQDCPDEYRADGGCVASVWMWCVCGRGAGQYPEMCQCDPIPIEGEGSERRPACSIFPDMETCNEPTRTISSTTAGTTPSQNTDLSTKSASSLNVTVYIGIGGGAFVLIIVIILINVLVCYCCYRSRNKPRRKEETALTENIGRADPFSTSFVYSQGKDLREDTAKKTSTEGATDDTSNVYHEIKPHEHEQDTAAAQKSPSNHYEMNFQHHPQEPKIDNSHDYVVVNRDTVEPYQPNDDTESEPDYFQLERADSMQSGGYGHLNVGLQPDESADQYDNLNRGLSTLVAEKTVATDHAAMNEDSYHHLSKKNDAATTADTGQYEDAYTHLSDPNA